MFVFDRRYYRLVFWLNIGISTGQTIGVLLNAYTSFRNNTEYTGQVERMSDKQFPKQTPYLQTFRQMRDKKTKKAPEEPEKIIYIIREGMKETKLSAILDTTRKVFILSIGCRSGKRAARLT